MRARTLLVPALAGFSLLSLTLVSTLRTASAQTPPPGAAGPAQGIPGRGGFGGFGQAGGLGGGAGEPPLMVAEGNEVFVLRRGVLYKINQTTMKLEGQLPLGPGGFGGAGGFGAGRPRP